ncbi:MAG TPA: thioesterase family protein [Polyangiales bacterium]|nr:thioesterase family protein [Polyangiales bacterium]
MLEVLRSSVNTWECDHMGHLNVRHYFGRANDGLAVLGLHLGLSPTGLRERGLMVRARDQHVRFARELRPGAVFSVHAGVVSSSDDVLVTYEELRNGDGEVSATISSELSLRDTATHAPRPWPSSVLDAARAVRCEVPAYGAARGVGREPASYRPSLSEAVERGLYGAYLGPVQAEDCDLDGVMRESACMARISDGIPHFFRALYRVSRPEGVGGAALEYRYAFHEWARASNVIEIRSGLKAIGRKTLHMDHFIFDVESGHCLAAAEAVAVWFDLQARKSMEVPAEIREQLATHVVPGLSL